MSSFTRTTALLTAAGFLVAWGAAFAADPTQADFDICNQQAQAATTTGAATPGAQAPSASPGTDKPDTQAPSASPSTDKPSVQAPSASPGTEKPAGEQQLRGMAAAGETNPAYKIAYRDCMKQRGF